MFSSSSKNYQYKHILVFQMLLAVFSLMLITFPVPTHGQNWTILPPYNTLWPLWSPTLSPLNPVTGLPVPIITSLKPSTILPVQPGLTWNPALSYPWLLYNSYSGLMYYDPVLGVDLWPPANLVDPITSTPLPISLPVNYAALTPTDPTWILNTVAFANLIYPIAYGAIVTISSISPPFIITPSALATDVFLISSPTTALLSPAAIPLLPVLPIISSPLPPTPPVPSISPNQVGITAPIIFIIPPVLSPTAILP